MVTSLHHLLCFVLPAAVENDDMSKAELLRVLKVVGGYSGDYIPESGQEPEPIMRLNDRLMRKYARYLHPRVPA